MYVTDLKPISKKFFSGKRKTNEISKSQVILKYLRVELLWNSLNICYLLCREIKRNCFE